MTNVEFFQNKNPKAPDIYCEYAATLYEVLLREDAFENGVQIKNFYTSFQFLFPNGKIEIVNMIPFSGAADVPCYRTHKNGTSTDVVHFTIGHFCSWLPANWDDLIHVDLT